MTVCLNRTVITEWTWLTHTSTVENEGVREQCPLSWTNQLAELFLDSTGIT